MSGKVLNPQPGSGEAPRGAVELSRALLHAARELGSSPEALSRLEALAGHLHAVDPTALQGDEARRAFWLNVYNALVRHAVVTWCVRGNLLWHLSLFSRAAYSVGGQRYSLNLIEHGLLRGNRPAPPLPLRTARPGDPRLAAAPARVDPRIHFALNCGARSCPPIRSYEPARLEAQLELATGAYLEAESRVDTQAHRVVLPRLLKYYREDFGSREEAVRLVARYLRPPEGPWLLEQASRVRVSYAPYDWSSALPHFE